MFYEQGPGESEEPSDNNVPWLSRELPANPKKQLQVWSEEQLQAAYECTLVGNPVERRTAIIQWSSRAGMSKGVPASRTGPRTALDAFDYLKSIFNSENSDLLKDAALRGISQFFRGSCEEEVTRFLASVVLSPEISTALRLTAYGHLWQVSEVRLNRAHKVNDSKRAVTLYPGPAGSLTADSSSLTDGLTEFLERVNHFTLEIQDPGFSIEHDIRWEWVESFERK